MGGRGVLFNFSMMKIDGRNKAGFKRLPLLLLLLLFFLRRKHILNGGNVFPEGGRGQSIDALDGNQKYLRDGEKKNK